MGSDEKPTDNFSGSDQALESYLSDLLGAGETDPAVPGVIKSISEKKHEEVKEESAPLAQSPVSRQETAENTGKSLPSIDQKRPQASQSKRQPPESVDQSIETIQIFKLGSLTLAARAQIISGHQPYPEQLENLPNSPEWFLGLFLLDGRKIAVVDPAPLVFGEKKQSNNVGSESSYENILLLTGSRWAIACDEIIDKKQFSKEFIRLRENSESKPWLIGTLTEPRAALVDLHGLIPIK